MQETMYPLLKDDSGSWYHRFCFRNGKGEVYYIAKEPSICGSGYFGNAAYIRKLMGFIMADGNPVIDETNLTDEGKMFLDANGDQKVYEELAKGLYNEEEK